MSSGAPAPGWGARGHRTDYGLQTTEGVRGGIPARGTSAPGVRRSLPNMATSLLLHEPAKLYPYHLLLITNYRLPPDVDRLNLEVGAGRGSRQKGVV